MSHTNTALSGTAENEAMLQPEALVDAEADSVPPPPVQQPPSKALRILLGLSLVLIAANLRPVFSSVSVLLPEIIDATGMSSVAAGILTTLPVVCLGVFAPFAPWLAQRFGAERVLLFVLAVLTVGTAIRGFGSFYSLYIGAALAGAAIATGNVLLPGVVKRDFPKTAAIMTGLYTMALCGGAASAAGFTIPIKGMLGGFWNLALAFWAVPAAIVLLLWLPQAMRAKHNVAHSGFKVIGLWKDKLARQVTLFMGLQSSTAYIVFGWLAPILREQGLSPAAAGGLVSFSILAQVITCLAVPSIATRQKNQSLLNVTLLCLCGLAVDRLSVSAAMDLLGTGGHSGHRAGRSHRRRHDGDRAARTGFAHRSASIRHGAMRRLYACSHWPAHRGSDPQRNGQLYRLWPFLRRVGVRCCYRRMGRRGARNMWVCR